MSIPRLAIQRPVTMFMISAVITLLGFISLTRLPVDLMPEFEQLLKITSPDDSPKAPNDFPSKTFPSSKAKRALIYGILSHNITGINKMSICFLKKFKLNLSLLLSCLGKEILTRQRKLKLGRKYRQLRLRWAGPKNTTKLYRQ